MRFFAMLILVCACCFSGCSDSKPKNESKTGNDQNQSKRESKKGEPTHSTEKKEEAGNQKISGSIKVSFDGEKATFAKWKTAGNAIRFFDHKATFYLFTDAGSKEQFQIEIFSKDLFNGPEKKEYSSCKYPIYLTDMEWTKKTSKAYIQLRYTNSETGDDFHSAKGTVELKKLNSQQLKLTFKGDGISGDWKKKNFVPVEFDLDINFDFVTADMRNKKNN